MPHNTRESLIQQYQRDPQATMRAVAALPAPEQHQAVRTLTEFLNAEWLASFSEEEVRAQEAEITAKIPVRRGRERKQRVFFCPAEIFGRKEVA